MKIKNIESLPEKGPDKVADLLEAPDQEREVKGRKEDALSKAIGTCEGPADLADGHDNYAH